DRDLPAARDPGLQGSAGRHHRRLHAAGHGLGKDRRGPGTLASRALSILLGGRRVMGAAVVEPPARVLIAAERRPTRARLRLALEPDARCSEAETADAAVEAAVRERPDVCLLGLKAGKNRLRAAAEIASRAPSVQVIVLSNHPDEDEFMAAMRGGAVGYLPQSLDPDRLPDVVRCTLRGEPAVPRRFV